MSPTIEIVIASLMVLLAAILIAGETALERASKVVIEQKRKEGSKKAALLLDMLDNRAKHVNSMLLGHVTLSTIAITLVTAAYIGPTAAEVSSIPKAIVTMVIVSFVLLGVAPQTIGRQYPESICLALCRVIRGLAIIFGPLSRVLILLGNAITPGKGYTEGPFSTQAELRALVDMAGADSVIEDEERQMIHSVFELGDTVAREVMVPRTEMVWIEQDKTLRQAMSLCLRSGFSRIPVVGESVDDVVGVVYLKDIAQRVFEHSESQTSEIVEEHMRPAFMVPDSKSVDELLKDMQAARTHLAVLVDEYGGTAGIVTIEDVLEEIVGDIADEYDVEVPEIEEVSEGKFRVSSRLHIGDLASLIGEEIDEEDVDTVGGYMAKVLGIVPITGAHITIGTWKLTAQGASGRRNRIGLIVVERDTFLESDDDDDD